MRERVRSYEVHVANANHRSPVGPFRCAETGRNDIGDLIRVAESDEGASV